MPLEEGLATEDVSQPGAGRAGARQSAELAGGFGSALLRGGRVSAMFSVTVHESEAVLRALTRAHKYDDMPQTFFDV